MTRLEFTLEAIRLGRLLYELLPKPEVMGLLVLMLLQESRSASRTSSDGDLILLEQQDRVLWNKEQIAEGIIFVERALASHHSARTRCKPPLRRFMPRRTQLLQPTGAKS